MTEEIRQSIITYLRLQNCIHGETYNELTSIFGEEHNYKEIVMYCINNKIVHVPVIYGDGEHDDTEAFNEWGKGGAAIWPDGTLVDEMKGKNFKINSTIEIERTLVMESCNIVYDNHSSKGAALSLTNSISSRLVGVTFQKKIKYMKVSLKTITPNSEVNIVEIARVSSNRTDKTENPEGLINYLIKSRHWSPFEHATMTIEIVTSKAIGIQLLRHRSFTFQEFSQRYAKVEAMEPIEIRQQAVKNRQSSEEVFDPTLDIMLPFEDDGGFRLENGFTASSAIADFLEHSQNLYNALLDAGVAKECARFILPMTTQTTIYMTGFVRNWIHFLDIRDDAHAQKEVQLIAKEIKKIFIQELPIISKALNYI